MDIRLKSVLLSLEGIKPDKEIYSAHGISTRTLRRWKSAYKKGGVEKLRPKSNAPKNQGKSITKQLEERILKLKQKHSSWGARRIKFQYDLPCHWKTVHNVIKRHKMLVRIKPKPQLASASSASM